VKYGETATYASKKSKAVPLPQRSTCAARDPWYDLTKLVDPGFALWPKAQQYRHIIPANPNQIAANCNLYDLSSTILSKIEQRVLVAILNSTLIGLFNTFYGRFAGTYNLPITQYCGIACALGTSRRVWLTSRAHR